MRDRFPLLRSLDPYHQRVGYLSALVHVAHDGLDTREAIRARLEELLFTKVYLGDETFSALSEEIDPGCLRELEQLRVRRSPEDNPASILMRAEDSSDWNYISELWLHASNMPSHLGIVPKEKLDRIIDLGRWTGILTPTFELSETGRVLKQLVARLAEESSTTRTFNFLNPLPRPALQVLFVYLFLNAEMLWPYVVSTLVDKSGEGKQLATRGPNGVLRRAVDALLAVVGNSTDPSELLDLRELVSFKESIESKPSTEENYLRPRLEILVDVGLIGRESKCGDRKNAFAWRVTAHTHRLADEWKELNQNPEAMPTFLDTRLFHSISAACGGEYTLITDDDQVLLWFAKGFLEMGREFGFTPGRTVAIMACLLAFEDKKVLEVSRVFDVVYGSASSMWTQYMRFSGGSRFDREFMIRVDPELLDLLRDKLRQSG
jgi:hypothetical protein